MPVADLHALIDHLPAHESAYARAELGELAGWRPADENLAMLVDAQRNWLQFMWSQWTATDADRKRRQRRRPPKTPPLLPYAVRPPQVTEALAAAAGGGDPEAEPSKRPGMRQMSIDQLAALI